MLQKIKEYYQIKVMHHFRQSQEKKEIECLAKRSIRYQLDSIIQITTLVIVLENTGIQFDINIIEYIINLILRIRNLRF